MKNITELFNMKACETKITILALTILSVVFSFVISQDSYATNYSVTYNDGVVSDLPVDVAGKTNDPSVAISSTTPVLSGYNFLGWCTVLPVDGGTCSGTTYQPGGAFTLDSSGSNNDLALYAMWESAGPKMQEATFADCGKNMTDNRDGTIRSYTTAEINGLCWMTTNLSLGKSTTTVLTPSNTNISSNYTLPASSTSGFSSYTDQNIYNAGVTNCSSDHPCYGYYTWAAATAGTNPSSGTASSDICPKGWRLPTQSELTTLKNSYTTGATLTGSPFLGVYAGGYFGSSFNNGGSSSYYWSSTADSSGAAYILLFNSSSASVVLDNKYAGRSIRCVKAPTMQDVSFSELDTLSSNGSNTVTLSDKRDNQTYTVAKINGIYWMTTNLALGKSTTMTLTPDDTNISSNYTLPASSTSGFDSYTAQNVYNAGMTSCSSGHPCYGYYTWAAATAGTNPSSGNATSDICPKGWRLPTQSEFTTLKNTYTTGATLTSSPFLGVYAGYYGSSAFYNGGSSGYYWSSTADSSSYAYRLYFGSSSASVVYSYKYYGGSIRCVKKIPSMQEQTTFTLATLMPNEGDSTTLVDARDGHEYTIRKINGQYWMTQNLRFQGTSISSSDTNINTNKTLTWYSLKNTSGCKGTSATTNNTTYMCKEDSGSTTTGVWYNYSAATAGTITGTSNSNAATQDICPAGWHLPTGPNTTSGTDYNKLVGNTTSGWQNPTTGLTAFGAVTGGIYNNGSIYDTGYGYWWSATAYNTAYRYYLFYNSSNRQFYGNGYSWNRYGGFSVRCVRSS